MAITGGHSALGNWSSPLALQCEGTYPIWKTCPPLKLPAGISIDYKYVKIRGQNRSWETFAGNRTITPQGLRFIVEQSFNVKADTRTTVEDVKPEPAEGPATPSSPAVDKADPLPEPTQAGVGVGAAEARTKEEAANDRRVEAEAKSTAAAGEKVIDEAEERAKAEAEAQAKADAETKARAEAEAKAEAEAGANAKVEADAKAQAEKKAQAEAEAKTKAETKAQLEADAKIRADAKAQAHADAKATVEKEAKTKAETEAKGRADGAAKERADSEAKAAPEPGPGAESELERELRRPEAPAPPRGDGVGSPVLGEASAEPSVLSNAFRSFASDSTALASSGVSDSDSDSAPPAAVGGTAQVSLSVRPPTPTSPEAVSVPASAPTPTPSPDAAAAPTPTPTPASEGPKTAGDRWKLLFKKDAGSTPAPPTTVKTASNPKLPRSATMPHEPKDPTTTPVPFPLHTTLSPDDYKFVLRKIEPGTIQRPSLRDVAMAAVAARNSNGMPQLSPMPGDGAEALVSPRSPPAEVSPTKSKTGLFHLPLFSKLGRSKTNDALSSPTSP